MSATISQDDPATGSADRTVRVTIAVPTYRRPDDLRVLLPMLAAHRAQVAGQAGGRYAVDLLVVDNDPDQSAAGVVDASPGVRYVTEPTPGIAAVRNRALQEASGSRLLAFIDDDERPGEDWLQHLVDTWRVTGAAAVCGRVLTEYAGELDPWLRAGDFFFRRSLPTGTALAVAATGNLLLDVEQVHASGLRFDTSLGLAGGEDTLFSRMLVRAGRRIVFCDESTVVDQVPAERMTRAWVLRRAWSSGSNAVLTDLRLSGRRPTRLVLRMRGIVQGLLRVGGGAGQWCWGVLGRSLRHRARGLRAVSRGWGMVGGAVGIAYQEYERGGRRWRRVSLPR